jgi:hypothetical protein
MANSSNWANVLSLCSDEGHRTIPSGLNPGLLIFCLLSVVRPGFKLPDLHPDSAPKAPRPPFTRALHLIAPSLPANCLINKGLAERIFWTRDASPATARRLRRLFISFTGFLPGKC